MRFSPWCKFCRAALTAETVGRAYLRADDHVKRLEVRLVPSDCNKDHYRSAKVKRNSVWHALREAIARMDSLGSELVEDDKDYRGRVPICRRLMDEGFGACKICYSNDDAINEQAECLRKLEYAERPDLRKYEVVEKTGSLSKLDLKNASAQVDGDSSFK